VQGKWGTRKNQGGGDFWGPHVWEQKKKKRPGGERKQRGEKRTRNGENESEKSNTGKDGKNL